MFKKTFIDIVPKKEDINEEEILVSKASLIERIESFLKKRSKEVLIISLVLICGIGGGWYYTTNQVDAPIGNIFKLQGVEAVNEEERARLEKELAEIDAQIAKYEKELSTTQTEKTTLQNAIATLKKKASSISLQIKSSQGNLTQIKGRIQDTEVAINQTISNIDKNKRELTNLLQALYQYSSTSDLEIFLAEEDFQDYFDKTNNINILQSKIKEKLVEMKALKGTLTEQKVSLDEKKDETQKLLSMQLLQQQELDRNKKEQEQLLSVTKGKEANYQKVLSEARKKAAEIRSRIYELVGVKSKVTFGEALDIANWVSAKTGIRPAFVLAVLTQESNLGSNVGTCNRPGDPPNKSYKVVMKPSRDQGPFEEITRKLGMDPNSTPVSCPMYKNGSQVGWGGAMGPAQFIPSTWVGYENKIVAITGRSPANPWNVTDAFVAASLYLTDKGAAKQTYDAEWRAAMIYFAGTVNTAYRFYGDNVMAIAKRYEADIASINKAK